MQTFQAWKYYLDGFRRHRRSFDLLTMWMPLGRLTAAILNTVLAVAKLGERALVSVLVSGVLGPRERWYDGSLLTPFEVLDSLISATSWASVISAKWSISCWYSDKAKFIGMHRVPRSLKSCVQSECMYRLRLIIRSHIRFCGIPHIWIQLMKILRATITLKIAALSKARAASTSVKKYPRWSCVHKTNVKRHASNSKHVHGEQWK